MTKNRRTLFPKINNIEKGSDKSKGCQAQLRHLETPKIMTLDVFQPLEHGMHHPIMQSICTKL